ncbi:ABC transporter substrate-binding protein [Nonomuraea sp. NPDC050404]|uniref:ABC transporter substrate-binding protein n=1 Tax=Nonomuraea sp. NPDC050404 TaxID=3155783 RepID=UPI003401EB7F
MRRVTFGLLAVSLGVLSGCGGAGAVDADSYVAAVPASMVENMLPGASQASNVDYALFTPLTRIDTKTGQVQNAVAASIESTDQKVWTIKIADGWTFHDGSPVTAQSFADSWNVTALGSNALTGNALMSVFEGYDELNPESGTAKATTLSGVKVVDDKTLEVTLNEPNSMLPYTLTSSAFAPIPAGAAKDIKAFATHPIGNGPFKARDGGWEVGAQDVYLDRYDKYAGPDKAASPSVNLRVYQNNRTYYTDLQAGQVDVALVEGEDLVSAKGNDAVSTVDVSLPAVVYLALPVYDKRLTPDIRKAISMAIDREAIVSSLLSGTAEAAKSLAPTVLTGADQVTCEACAFDPARAKDLLAKAGGWSGELNLQSYQGGNNDKVLEAVANQLRTNLGIQDVSFDTIEISQLWTGLRAKKAKGPALLYSGVPYPHVYAMANALFTAGAPLNASRYDNSSFGETLAKAASAAKPEDAVKYAAQAASAALAEMPIAPLYYPKAGLVHSDRVSGVSAEVLGGAHLSGIKVQAG